jgi:hypothetical protein
MSEDVDRYLTEREAEVLTGRQVRNWKSPEILAQHRADVLREAADWIWEPGSVLAAELSRMADEAVAE